MVQSKTVDVRGIPYTVIAGSNGVALVSSKSEAGAYHVVKDGRCDCRGFAYRHRCSHLDAIAPSSAPSAHCQHCGHEGTAADPVVVRFERLHSHSQPVQTVRCLDEVACWHRYDRARGLVS